MRFTQIPADTFKNIQLNAGILVKDFKPATGVITDIIGATSGGVTFEATPSYTDYGDDIDNCPKNTKELKKLDSWEAKMSGTFVTVTAELTNHQGRASKRMQRRHAADKRKERRLKPLLFSAKRYTRIELASQPWEGRILPLN